ncbi:unnamed protein product, partial [Didymodactylos carnosus]
NQRKALKKLKTDKNIIVIPADKGEKVVVMDVVDCIDKIQEKLDTDSYTQLNEDPSKYIHKKLQILLSELVGKGEIDEDMMETLLVDKNIPIVRGQLKVHKVEKSMKLIVAMRNSMGSTLAKYITNILKDIADNRRSIKNTKDLIEKLYKLKIKKVHSLASLDVIDLFTTVDRNKVLHTLSRLLEGDESWKSKTSLSFWNVEFWRILADVALSEFLLEKWNYKKFPYVGLARYVDDILLISNMNRDTIKELTEYLNSFKELQFTFEFEKNNIITFLDVCIHINREKEVIETNWFRKETASALLNKARKIAQNIVQDENVLDKRGEDVVYGIPCMCADMYVGETCSFKRRIKEHFKKVQQRDAKGSELAQHHENVNMQRRRLQYTPGFYRQLNNTGLKAPTLTPLHNVPVPQILPQLPRLSSIQPLIQRFISRDATANATGRRTNLSLSRNISTNN